MNSELAEALDDAARTSAYVKSRPPKEFEGTIFSEKSVFQAPYRAVKTWEDLLVTNLAFLHDKFIPFYYPDFLGAEDAGHRASIQTLIDLHLYGVFTQNGQGNTCEYDDVSSMEERPYVDASIPRGMWPAIKAQLDKFRDVAHYVAFDCASNSVIDTTFQASDFSDSTVYRQNVYTLTRDRGERSDPWNSATGFASDHTRMCLFINDAEAYPHVQDMLKQGCYQVSVIMRNFCSPKLADALLLQCVKRAGFKPRMKDPYRDMKVDAATKLQALARRRSAQRRVQGMRAQRPQRVPVATVATVPIVAPAPRPVMSMSSLPLPSSVTPATLALFAYILQEQKKPTTRRRRRSRSPTRRSTRKSRRRSTRK